MNPQFQPPQSFPQNRASPALAQQGNFQNIPLGPQKPGMPISNGPMQTQNNIPSSFQPQSGPFQPPLGGQYGPPSDMRAPPSNRGFPGIPSNQLPPQAGNLGHPGMPSPLNKNQLPVTSAGGLGALSNATSQAFPSVIPPSSQTPTSFAPPPSQIQQGPPPSQQPPQGLLIGQQPPQGLPPNQQPPQGPPLKHQTSQSLLSNQQPPQGFLSNQQVPQGLLSNQQRSQGPPPSQQPPQGHPLKQQPLQGLSSTQQPAQRLPQGLTSNEQLSQGPPPSQQPPQGPSVKQQTPQGPPPSQQSPSVPPTNQQPPQGSNSNQFSQQRTDPKQLPPQGPHTNQQFPGSASNQFPPQSQLPPSNQFSLPGPPRNQTSPKLSENSHNGQSSNFPPPKPSGPFNPLHNQHSSDLYYTNGTNAGQFGTNQPQFSAASFPPSGPPMGSIPPGPNKSNFGPINQFNSTNLPGQLPPQNQYGQPPLPGSGQNQFAPPLPGQPPINPNQLSNQMQGMNLNGPRQYPSSGGLKSGFDGGLHMPPPLSQQQQNLVNGQQLRSPQSQGYPPMPGQGGGQAGYLPQGGYPQSGVQGGGSYPQGGYQQAQQRRLDPDQMPSPIQVMQDDQQGRSGVFVTNQKGLVPPLVSTKFVVQDQGNASPRYVRSTMYNVPISQDLIKQTAVPFGLVISPMARIIEGEYPPPVVNFGDLGPVRCIRCKAYMCPYMQFIDSGRRFQCLFCKAATDVPAEYFQHLDHTGQRMDRFERPELVLGTYEFTATPDYCRNNTLPKPPAMIFIIDVSYNTVKSGLINLLCSQMKDIIKNLPVDQGQEKSNMKVGFITYNSSVHFYNIKENLAAPQMLVVGDVQDMFMPLLDGFLCTPEESEVVIDALMEQIPIMFADTRETETVLLPAILAGLEALKASECVGKLLVFHSSLPTAEAPGKLRMRDERKLLGTEKERTVLTPQTQAYNQLGQDCVQSGCSVDLFIFNNSYIDIATISQVSRLTGGEVYKYTYFQADVDGERLIEDIIRNISRPIAFDAVMRVRTSTGVRPTDFYGHCYMSNTTDIELAAIDCDKALAVEIKHDDKLSEDEGIYIQIALLYTSSAGQRRLRILNLSLKTCSQMADLYRSCELDTLINFFAKQSVYRLLEHNPKTVKDGIINRSAQILANYRKNCASPSSAGQLILPECMKLLPLYINCLLKSDALSGGADMTIDDRSFVMQAVMTMDVPSSLVYFYPRLIPLHEINPDAETIEIPFPIRCTIEKMSDQGVYVLENGIHMFVWIGLGADQEFIQQVFGVPSAVQVNIEMTRFPELDNPLSIAVRSVVKEIRSQHHRCMRLTFVKPREKLEPVFKHFLVEDRGVDGSSSYVDFLCHMHKEIRNLLS